jgi:DNA modification methylase
MRKVFFGDCLHTLRKLNKQQVKVQMCVTSPPYFNLRDYGNTHQIGLEKTDDEFIAKLVLVFREVYKLLENNGTLWLNIGDSYAKNKQLLMIPARLALALQKDGWILRQDIIWNKTNSMPESVTDRCVASHEHVFLFSKNKKYLFNHLVIKEPSVGLSKGSSASFKRTNSKRGLVNSNLTIPTHRADRPDVSYSSKLRNKRSVWNIATTSFKGAHFAVFPLALIEPCILAGSIVNSIVLDPFLGSGTTAVSCILNNRQFIGCELNPSYKSIQLERINLAKLKIK